MTQQTLQYRGGGGGGDPNKQTKQKTAQIKGYYCLIKDENRFFKNIC